MTMVKGKTESGFKYEVDSEIMKDVDFLEKFTEMEKGGEESLGAFFDVNKIMLGEDQYKALKDHLKKKNGKAEIEALTEEIKEIVDAVSEEVQEVKNS